MNREQYEAIKARALLPPVEMGELIPAIVCVDVMHNIVNPDELPKDLADRFKAQCQQIADAVRDREALIKFIEDGFDIDWFDKDAEAPSAQTSEASA